MITFWQQENGKLISLKKEELDSSKKTWIDARCVTREDISVLENEYKIEQEHILDILDPDELSRIEDADDYVLTIMRLPIFVPTAEVPYFSIPFGVIVMPKKIITICWTDCEVLKDFAANRVKGISLNDFPAFIIQIMSRGDITYLRYLKEINRRAASIQGELQYAVENKEIIQFLNLEKSLVFFTTSLKSNQLLLEKFRKTKLFRLDEDDRDWLDDVEIDNRQALEMADTYSEIFSRIIDAFGSVISNNMNVVMKKLTMITVVISVPTFITSFFGMNIYLPFANLGQHSVVIVTGICLAGIGITNLFLNQRGKLFKKERKSIKHTYKKKVELRKLKKQIELTEAGLEGKK